MNRLPPGVKQTSGGTFDHTERPVYFIASSPAYIENTDPEQAPHVLIAVNEIKNEADATILRKFIDQGRKVLLDSGIFNLANEHAHRHNMTHNEALNLAPHEVDGFPHLLDKYKAIVSVYADRLWGVIELDLGGRENKKFTRAILETDIPDFVPIPVYHPLGDGWDYFDELAQSYDRICCGNIVQTNYPDRLRLAYTFHERAKKYPYLWTHLLGYTPAATTVAMPPQGSCDSSSWCGALRWGMSSDEPRSLLQSQGSIPWDNRFNRDVSVDANDPTGYESMKRWASYRYAIMKTTWTEIEDAKRDLGLTTSPEIQL